MIGRGPGTLTRGLSVAGLCALALLVSRPSAAETAPASMPAKPAVEKKGPAFGPALFDKKKPIEITSDQLDVDQAQKTAIFEGKVDAIQGEIHLRADRLKVYYDTIETPAPQASPAPAEGTAAPGPADPGAAGGKIRRMDVDGHVFVSSPTETASGDKGVYEAETGKIVLTGNVILTRGGNIIRGTKLAIDVDSGRSIIDAKSSAGGGRVRGLFVPKKDQDTNATSQSAQSGGAKPDAGKAPAP
jgi:lipopolysaccharide export system protein LptA